MHVRPIVFVLLASLLGGCGGCGTERDEAQKGDVVAVEVAPVEAGTIRDARRFSGSLEAATRFTVTAKVSGLLEGVRVELGDRVDRGQVVATVDDAEPTQATMQAQGQVAVDQAAVERAEIAVELAATKAERARDLHARKLVPQAEVDDAMAALASAKAQLSLARGQRQQSAATLRLNRIKQGYTEVRAQFPEHLGKEAASSAVVAMRHQDPGTTIQLGEPIVDVVVLDPIVCVIHVPERDYSRLAVGQGASLTTDTVPGVTFDARVARIAPVFSTTSRQAAVELVVDNADLRLKPGAFATVQIVLGTEEATSIVPRAALAERGGRDVVFVVEEGTARMRTVTPGIVEGDRVQLGEALKGPVVTLGQHLLGDGSGVRVIESPPPPNHSPGGSGPG